MAREPFDLGDFLKNPERKLVTRHGMDARVICTDRKHDEFPVVLMVKLEDNIEYLVYVMENGRVDKKFENNFDIFFAEAVPHDENVPVEFVPYETAEECVSDMLKHGSWVKNIYGSFIMLCNISDTTNFPAWFEMYVWADDGTPVGKKKKV